MSKNRSWEYEASLLSPAQLMPALLAGQPPLDASRPWAPRGLPPLASSEKFSVLTKAQQLRYNHIYARQLVAQFVWAESALALPGLHRLLSLPHPHDTVLPILQSFVADETNHINSFSTLEKLAVAAEPPPAGHNAPLFSPPMFLRVLTAVAARFPGNFVAWIEMVEAFEIYTLKIGQLYMQDKAVDPLFRNAFIAHARDEARHCRLDKLLTEWLQSRCSDTGKWLSDRYVKLFVASFMSVEWGLDGPVREFILAHPEVTISYETLLAETKLHRGKNQPLEMSSSSA